MKIFIRILVLCITISNSLGAYASESITRGDAFIYFANQHKDEVPSSYKYINLHYQGVQDNSDLENALKILVYLDLIKNVSVNIGAQQQIDEADIISMEKILGKKQEEVKITISSSFGDSTHTSLGDKEKILFDVYNTLNKDHYDRSKFEDNALTQGAIKGIADATGDKYTSYFPPVESDDFFDSLGGQEYEGIGAYVEMPTPGELIIVAPIVGSPSEEAGIKGGDRITHVDDREITEQNPIKEVITWIKGPAGTQVKLTVEREGEKKPLEIYVTRGNIIIKDVEHKKIDRNTYYIQIKNFGENVDTDFKEALTEISKDKNINKIIFDVRNNPGGYLSKVSNMLSYFVESGEPTAIVDSRERELEYRSLGYELLDFDNYEIILIQNGGSASASEIFVGTVKDYYPESTIIGEQSFGKGSVQTLKTYNDGSTLKYTTAKWFTGKTKQGIDGIGISPDLELEFDAERWDTFKKDNQLEKAINY